MPLLVTAMLLSCGLHTSSSVFVSVALLLSDHLCDFPLGFNFSVVVDVSWPREVAARLTNGVHRTMEYRDVWAEAEDVDRAIILYWNDLETVKCPPSTLCLTLPLGMLPKT
jgi:hypothetical protein